MEREIRTIHRMPRRARLVLLALAGVSVATLLGLPTLLAAVGGVPWAARDFDCSGVVSVGEWYSGGLDYGWRHAIGGPPECMEVFSLKDGLAVVQRCPGEPRCRIVRRLPKNDR